MEVVHPRCAGIDISKKDAKVCVRIQGSGRRPTNATVTTWGAMTNQILALCEHLLAEKVTCVVMEATGEYWKPYYYLLEDTLPVMLVNAHDARNMPGRKTDVSDAAWLADLGAHGLLRGSLVPPPPIRRLRDLTRARTALTRDRGRAVQRIEKVLEDAGIKLSSVATDIMGVSGRLMLEALIDGSDDPAAMADLAKRRLRVKIPALTEALTGRFTAHHGFLIRMHLTLIDQYGQALGELDDRIAEAIEPFRAARDLLISIPGFSTVVAEVFLAETGGDMSVFPTAGHLASWAGTAPGSNESAGRVKSTKTRPGNRHLKGALGTAALSVSRSKGTYFSAKYKRIASHRDPMKALVAVEHAMLVAAWNMLTNGDLYRDPGADYFTRRTPTKTRARAVGQLEALGYRVILEPLADTA
ncbi:IS110 family transposase [Rhodococcus koreensis]|uniref:Transposase n=1 Tax=Rhodococcus koreensis TaxID=99653 RepID=A0A1H4UWP5_9NOCA|nr:IS110 family transposase [Rhodococcus koreensis]SEC73292.1 Transposase [Rhodococcus koreensis]SED20773.1 Transposase [Rhodococcus koreensis]